MIDSEEGAWKALEVEMVVSSESAVVELVSEAEMPVGSEEGVGADDTASRRVEVD